METAGSSPDQRTQDVPSNKRPRCVNRLGVGLALTFAGSFLLGPSLVQEQVAEPAAPVASSAPGCDNTDDGACDSVDAVITASPVADEPIAEAPATTATVVPPPPKAPIELPKNVAPVCGIASGAEAACGVKKRTDIEGSAPAASNALAAAPTAAPASAIEAAFDTAASPHVIGNGGGYDPAYLRSAYNLAAFPSNAGTGRTVAIVTAYDSPTAEADLAAYRTQFGLPACTTANGCFRKVNQNGQASPLPAANSGWATETSLDMDMVSAICPNCKILIVEANTANFSDMGPAVNTAAAMGANAINNSYGANEFVGATTFDSYYNHPGVLVTVSTGDNGYGVSYPASSRYVVAVGGTSLNQATNTGTRNATESVWTGAGSGCSALSTKPSWQHDSGCVRRSNADISAVADPNTGVWIYAAGHWSVVGGTSASSPIVAAMGMLFPTVFTASDIYSATGLIDITTGSNGSCGTYLCRGQAGYDGPTGMGVINGPNSFGAAVSGVDFAIAATPATQSVGPNSSTRFSVRLTAPSAVSGPITLSLSGAPAGTTLSASTLQIRSTSAATTITTPTTASAGTYTITVNATGGGHTHSTTLTLIVGDFAIQSSATPIPTGAGLKTQTSVTLDTSTNYASLVSLTASGMPTGMMVRVPSRVTPSSGGTVALVAISTTSATPVGTYAITIRAADQGTPATVRTTTINVTANNYTFALTQPSLSTSVGHSVTNTARLTALSTTSNPTVNFTFSGLPKGVTAQVAASPSPVPALAGTDVVITFTASNEAIATNTTVRVMANATGYGKQTVSMPLLVAGVNGTATASSIARGTSGTTSLTLTSVGSVPGTVSLSYTLPVGITMSSAPSSASVSGTPSSTTLTFAVASNVRATTYKIPIVVTAAGFPPRTVYAIIRAT